MRVVPGDRIGEIVAEVDSHVAETGEEPDDAFGPAGDSIRQFANPQSSVWAPRALVAPVLCFASGILLVTATLGIVR